MSAAAVDRDGPGPAGPEVGPEVGTEPPTGGPRAARIAAIVVGVVLVLFIGVLATRRPAEDRFGPNPLLGKAVPRVAGTTLQGDTVDIDQLRGKWVVVNFFATWCTGCRVEHPELVKFSEAHKAAGDAEVVSVAFSDQTAALEAFFRQQGGDWPVLVGDTGQMAIDFGVTGIPESFVITPSGQVAAHFNGVTADALDRVIAEVSAADAAAAGGAPPGTGVRAP